MLKVLTAIFLFLLVPLLARCSGTTTGQMKSVSLSPDGKLVAVDFVKDATSFIYVIPVNTGMATRLTEAKDGEESSPAFSADGKRIAYIYRPSGHRRPRIVIVNADGSDLRRWPPSGGADFSPVFSPDNKTIVFGRAEYSVNYSPVAPPHPLAWTFYASDLDGKNIRRVTDQSLYHASPASVSPDGKKVVVIVEDLDNGSHIAIYPMEKTGPLRYLRPHVPKDADQKDAILNFPNFMPDGKSILFIAARQESGVSGYEIYRVDSETGDLESLTQRNGYATSLRVSGDGKTAVFLKWSDSQAPQVTSVLYLLDVESHSLTPLIVAGLD